MQALMSIVSAIGDFMQAGGRVDAIGVVTASAVLVVLSVIAALEATDRRTREAPRLAPVIVGATGGAPVEVGKAA